MCDINGGYLVAILGILSHLFFKGGDERAHVAIFTAAEHAQIPTLLKRCIVAKFTSLDMCRFPNLSLTLGANNMCNTLVKAQAAPCLDFKMH